MSFNSSLNILYNLNCTSACFLVERIGLKHIFYNSGSVDICNFYLFKIEFSVWKSNEMGFICESLI